MTVGESTQGTDRGEAVDVTVDEGQVAGETTRDDADEVTVEEATQDEQADADSKSPRARRWGVARRFRFLRSKLLLAILLAVALAASAGLAGWLYFFQYRADRHTDQAAAVSAVNAAKAGTVLVLSYSPDSLDQDFAKAKPHLTGDFLSYYTGFTERTVGPAAKQKSIKTTASVVRAAVSELHSDSAVVLVFVNQTTTSKDNPAGAFAASAVRIGLKKINGAWLISAFDPV